jgi:hypothetical protein
LLRSESTSCRPGLRDGDFGDCESAGLSLGGSVHMETKYFLLIRLSGL